jgi:hypothetical protein
VPAADTVNEIDRGPHPAVGGVTGMLGHLPQP